LKELEVIKKIIISLLVIGVICINGLLGIGFPTNSPTEVILLKIPVRVLTKNALSIPSESVKNLSKNDFILKINGETARIVEFFPKSRAVTGAPNNSVTDANPPGSRVRQFALSFDINEFGKPVSDALSAFIRDTLTKSDSLLVRSPLNIFKINTDSPKDEILEYITTNVKSDIAERNQDKTLLRNSLYKMLDNIQDRLDSKKIDLESVRFFINYFSTEWNMFCSQFLSTNIEQFSDMTSRFIGENKDGEKWLIHFHESEITTLHDRFKSISPKIKSYLASITGKTKLKVPPVLERLEKTEKILDLVSNMGTEDLANNFMSSGVNFNVIFLSSTSSPQSISSPESIDYGFDEILKALSIHTGGIYVETGNPVEAITSILKHTDYYYELGFVFDGNTDDKIVEILSPGSSGMVFYKSKFKKEELKYISPETGNEALSISDVTLNGKKISFKITGILSTSTQKTEDNRIKINIRLFDDKLVQVYETGNILKPSGNSLSISLDLPPEHQGYFKMVIDVFELSSGRSSQASQYVKI